VDRRRPPDRDGRDPLTADSARWVASQADLAEVVDELRPQPEYALDTEFHRERTYHARLALLQLSWPGATVLVDPLAVSVAPLREVLEGPGVAVMHAASQDVEILERACGTPPRELFDTQIAAGFLGYGTPGLASLLRGTLGVELPKADRLTDWTARPLEARVREYAATDVAHLLDLAALLREQLAARGRLAWVHEECELARVRHGTPNDPELAWWRIKDARALRGRGAAVAQAVAAWREERAATIDRPLRTVLSDLAIVAIAQRPPADEMALNKLRGFDGRQVRGKIASELLGAVTRGLAMTPDEVRLPPVDGVDRSQRAAVTLVSAWVGQLAREQAIEPSLLATRADVEELLAGRAGRLTTGWRAGLVGEPASALARGDAALAFGPSGDLVLESRSGKPWPS
jgi:ribonuclease D